MQGDAVWEIVVFMLNALLFVLIGLQLPVILDKLSGESASTLIGYGAIVAGDGDPGRGSCGSSRRRISRAC